jgi:hypothetical protein
MFPVASVQLGPTENFRDEVGNGLKVFFWHLGENRAQHRVNADVFVEFLEECLDLLRTSAPFVKRGYVLSVIEEV